MLLENKNENQKEFSRESLPLGSQKAIYIGMTRPKPVEYEYAGQKKTRNMANFIWQLEKRQANGRPFVAFDYLSTSWFKPKPGQKGNISNLRKKFEGWLGPLPESFDPDTKIGEAGYLNLQQSDRTDSEGKPYVNIAGISPLPEEVKANIPLLYRLEEKDGELKLVYLGDEAPKAESIPDKDLVPF